MDGCTSSHDARYDIVRYVYFAVDVPILLLFITQIVIRKWRSSGVQFWKQHTAVPQVLQSDSKRGSRESLPPRPPPPPVGQGCLSRWSVIEVFHWVGVFYSLLIVVGDLDPGKKNIYLII